jgi:hypothetical protein
MKSITTRPKRSPDAIRDALLALGLQEDPKPVDGQAFTHRADPEAAEAFCRSARRFVPTRFHIDRHTFTLSD